MVRGRTKVKVNKEKHKKKKQRRLGGEGVLERGGEEI